MQLLDWRVGFNVDVAEKTFTSFPIRPSVQSVFMLLRLLFVCRNIVLAHSQVWILYWRVGESKSILIISYRESFILRPLFCIFPEFQQFCIFSIFKWINIRTRNIFTVSHVPKCFAKEKFFLFSFIFLLFMASIFQDKFRKVFKEIGLI